VVRIGSIFLLLFGAASVLAEELFLHLEYPAPTNRSVVLKGADARQQLLATWMNAQGAEIDVTRDVSYAASPADVVRIG